VPGGTSITVFLPDGNPDGARLVYKSHWTGIAVTAPRSRYADVRADRDELRRPGVYVLLGPAGDPAYEARIYVGEGEDPRVRIDSHHTNQRTASANRLHLKGPSAQGEGAEVEDGFLVFTGALARAETVASFKEWTKSWADLRGALIESGVLVQVEGGASLRFASDYVFRSPSAAGAILLGRTANGLIEWKDSSGSTLKQLREQMVAATPNPSQDPPSG
jgi:hypothetical protein